MSEAPVITLRVANGDDEAFLQAVYTSTREAELASTGWSDEQKAAFCAQQFHAQDAHYRKHYPTAQFFVIEVEKQPAGRLYVDHWENEIRIMDIALLPSFRGRGIGTHFLRELQKEAQNALHPCRDFQSGQTPLRAPRLRRRGGQRCLSTHDLEP